MSVHADRERHRLGPGLGLGNRHRRIERTPVVGDRGTTCEACPTIPASTSPGTRVLHSASTAGSDPGSAGSSERYPKFAGKNGNSIVGNAWAPGFPAPGRTLPRWYFRRVPSSGSRPGTSWLRATGSARREQSDGSAPSIVSAVAESPELQAHFAGKHRESLWYPRRNSYRFQGLLWGQSSFIATNCGWGRGSSIRAGTQEDRQSGDRAALRSGSDWEG